MLVTANLIFLFVFCISCTVTGCGASGYGQGMQADDLSERGEYPLMQPNKTEPPEISSPEAFDSENQQEAYYNLFLEEVGIRKYRRIVKLYHLRDFSLLYVALEVALSLALRAVTALDLVPSAGKAGSLLLLIAFLGYCVAVFFGTVHIYLGESSPQLFCKTALPALALLVIPALVAGYTESSIAVWCFAPMRLFVLLYSQGAFQSIVTSCMIVGALVLAAFLLGCWITNARMNRRIRW